MTVSVTFARGTSLSLTFFMNVATSIAKALKASIDSPLTILTILPIAFTNAPQYPRKPVRLRSSMFLTCTLACIISCKDSSVKP